MELWQLFCNHEGKAKGTAKRPTRRSGMAVLLDQTWNDLPSDFPLCKTSKLLY